MSRQVSILPALLSICLSAVGVTATERSWMRSYSVIVDKEQTPTTLAEFTKILTTDGLQPAKARYLYKDKNGDLLVIRNETDKNVMNTITSFRFLATGEFLSIEVDSQQMAQVKLGTESFQFEDDGEQHASSSVQQDAASLMATASSSFKDALELLTTVGLEYSIELRTPAQLLSMIFFNRTVSWAPAFETSIEEEPPAAFDASTRSPNTFEQQFGTHYYE